MLKMKHRTYKLIGLTPILGAQPAAKNLREKWIATKAPKLEDGLEEADMISVDQNESGFYVFNRYQLPAKNGRDGEEVLCMMMHQIKGFFKESLGALKYQSGMTQHKSKIDTLLFVDGRHGRYIPLTRDGEYIIDPDEQLERPIRVETPKGPRTALNSSEMLNEPWGLVVDLSILDNNARGKSDALTWEKVELAMEYGGLHGLGQWRNAGYGSFRFELLEGDD